MPHSGIQDGDVLKDEGRRLPEDESLGGMPVAGAATGVTSYAEVAEADSAVAGGRRLPPIFNALRHRTFAYYWSGNFVSNVGTWMQNVVQGWFIMDLAERTGHRPSIWLGVVGTLSSAPFLVFTLYGGVIADRVNKRRFMMLTQTAMMLFAFTMAALTWLKVVTIWEVAGLALMTGISASLNAPVFQAIVPSLVPRKDLPNAVALNTVQFNLSRILGPTVGGFSWRLIGPAGNFFANGLSFFAVVLALLKIRLPEDKPRERQHAGVWESVREGFHYVRATRPMWGIVTMVASISLFVMPSLTFIPYFARNVLHSGVSGLSLLMASSGTGALVSALIVANYVGRRGNIPKRGPKLFVAILGVMVGLILFCHTTNFHVACALMFVEGFGMIFSVAVLNMSMQQLATDEMRGRVMGIYSTAFLGLPPIGIGLVTLLLLWLTTPTAITVMTVIGMVGFVTVFARSRSLRRFN